MSHQNVVHKHNPMLPVVDKEWEMLKNLPARQEAERQTRTRGHRTGTERMQNRWTCATSKNSELDKKFQTCEGRAAPRGDVGNMTPARMRCSPSRDPPRHT